MLCVVCNKEFVKNNSDEKCCSKECKAKRNFQMKLIASRKWNSKNKEKHKEMIKASNENTRIEALNIVGNNKIECSNCGCKDIIILEINHINCNAKQDKRKGRNLWYDIIKGIRKTDDLNILCKICNIAHFVKFKYNINYKIKSI